MSSQPSPGKEKKSRSGSGKRRREGGLSQQPLGTPLDIAALPSANQVTLHSDDDAGEQTKRKPPPRVAKRKGKTGNKAKEPAEEKNSQKEADSGEAKQQDLGEKRPTVDEEEETNKLREVGSQDPLRDHDAPKEKEDIADRPSLAGITNDQRSQGAVVGPKQRKGNEKAVKPRKVAKGGEESGGADRRTFIDLSQDSDDGVGDQKEEEDEIPLTQRETRQADHQTNVVTNTSATAEKGKEEKENVDEEDEESEEEADPLLLVTKRRQRQKHSKKGKPLPQPAKPRTDGKPNSADELDPGVASSASAGDNDEEAGSGPSTQHHTPKAIPLPSTHKTNGHDGKEAEAEDEDKNEDEEETAGEKDKKETHQERGDENERRERERERSERAKRTTSASKAAEEKRGWYRKMSTVEDAEEEEESEDEETPSQKERKRKAKGKEKAKEGEKEETPVEEEDEDDDEEEEITGSQMPPMSVRTYGQEEEEEEEEDDEEETSSSPSVCPMCNKSIKHMGAKAREAHVNSCIDARQQKAAEDPDFIEEFHCELCGKDMTKWNAQRRQQHMERCLDKFTDKISQQLPQQGADQEDEDFGSITGARYRCSICRSDRSNSSLEGRIDHLKKCARKHNLSVESFRNTKKWNEMVNGKAGPAPSLQKKPKRGAKKATAASTSSSSSTTKTRAKRTRATKKKTKSPAAEKEAEDSEVRSKFFGGELDTVSHANFLATIAKLRYKQKAGQSGAPKDAAVASLSDGDYVALQLPAQPQPLLLLSTALPQPSPTVAVGAPASAASFQPSSSSSSSSSSTSSTSAGPPTIEPAPGRASEDEDEDFAADPHFKRPPAMPPNKNRKTTRAKKMNYADLLVGLDKEDEELMLAVALSDSLAPVPVPPPAPVPATPESTSPRDLAGFKVTEESRLKLDKHAVAQVMEDLFPDESQEIRPTPKLAESSLARRSPQPSSSSLWALNSSGAGAFDPVFIKTSVLPESDKQQLADKAKLHPRVTAEMLESDRRKPAATNRIEAEKTNNATSATKSTESRSDERIVNAASSSVAAQGTTNRRQMSAGEGEEKEDDDDGDGYDDLTQAMNRDTCRTVEKEEEEEVATNNRGGRAEAEEEADEFGGSGGFCVDSSMEFTQPQQVSRPVGSREDSEHVSGVSGEDEEEEEVETQQRTKKALSSSSSKREVERRKIGAATDEDELKERKRLAPTKSRSRPSTLSSTKDFSARRRSQPKRRKREIEDEEDLEEETELQTEQQVESADELGTSHEEDQEEDGDHHIKGEEEDEEEEEEEEEPVEQEELGTVEARKKRFVARAEAVMRDYKASCLEAQRMMEERMQEIKDAYLAEIGRITIEKESRLQRLQERYQVTSSLLLSSPLSPAGATAVSAVITTASLRSSSSRSSSSGRRPQPKSLSLSTKRKPAPAAPRHQRRTKRSSEDQTEQMAEIGPSQLVVRKSGSYAQPDSDEDFKPTRHKRRIPSKKPSVTETEARKRRKKETRVEEDEEGESEEKKNEEKKTGRTTTKGKVGVRRSREGAKRPVEPRDNYADAEEEEEVDKYRKKRKVSEEKRKRSTAETKKIAKRDEEEEEEEEEEKEETEGEGPQTNEHRDRRRDDDDWDGDGHGRRGGGAGGGQRDGSTQEKGSANVAKGQQRRAGGSKDGQRSGSGAEQQNGEDAAKRNNNERTRGDEGDGGADEGSKRAILTNLVEKDEKIQKMEEEKQKEKEVVLDRALPTSEEEKEKTRPEPRNGDDDGDEGKIGEEETAGNVVVDMYGTVEEEDPSTVGLMVANQCRRAPDEVIQIEIHSSPPDGDRQDDHDGDFARTQHPLRAEERIRGDPLSFIITKKNTAKVPGELDASLSESDNDGNFNLASTPPEGLGTAPSPPFSFSSAATRTTQASTMTNTRRSARILDIPFPPYEPLNEIEGSMSLLRPSAPKPPTAQTTNAQSHLSAQQPTKGRLSPWSARILAQKKRKEAAEDDSGSGNRKKTKRRSTYKSPPSDRGKADGYEGKNDEERERTKEKEKEVPSGADDDYGEGERDEDADLFPPSPTPPPPPLTPLTPPAAKPSSPSPPILLTSSASPPPSSSSSMPAQHDARPPLTVFSQGDVLQASPLLFSPVHVSFTPPPKPPLRSSASTSSMGRPLLPQLVSDLDDYEEEEDENSDDGATSATRANTKRTEKEKAKAKEREEEKSGTATRRRRDYDDDEEEKEDDSGRDVTEEIEEERRRWINKNTNKKTTKKKSEEGPKRRLREGAKQTKEKTEERRTKRSKRRMKSDDDNSDEEEKNEEEGLSSPPPLPVRSAASLLSPARLAPRELLRSPIRTLSARPCSQDDRHDHHDNRRTDQEKRRKPQSVEDDEDEEDEVGTKRSEMEDEDEDDERSGKNAENMKRRRGREKGRKTRTKSKTGDAAGDGEVRREATKTAITTTTTTTTTDTTTTRDESKEEEGLETPTCSPRTTMSLHAKRCYNTPKPSYDDMSDSLLKTLLSGYGVRGGSRKWMVSKLTEIWEGLHDPAKALPVDHPSIVRGVKLFAHEKEEDPKKKEKELELASRVTAWVKTNKRIYLQVLQYKEIDLLELQTGLKEEGIKCGREFLASYLNGQGVVFRGPKKKNRGWRA